MKIEKLIEGLKANYPESQHPTEVRQKDFVRTLKNMGLSAEQHELLYNELLRKCEFFPKVYDLHAVVGSLAIERSENTAVSRTRKMLTEREMIESEGGVTFREWLRDGGLQQIIEDCGGDMARVKKVLGVMGVSAIPDYRMPEKKADHTADADFLTEHLPEGGFEDDNRETLEDL